jgi:hypothetical protein
MTGRGFLINPPGGSVEVDASTGAKELVARRMLGRWARAVQRDAHIYYLAAMRVSWMDWAIDRGEDWSPTEDDLAEALEEVWIRGYQLVMATNQMENWQQVHAGSVHAGTTDDELLSKLRNSIEHLNDAAFTEDFARKNPESRRRHQAIDTLPNNELFLGGVPADLVESVFGVLPLESLVARARQHACVDVPDEPEEFNQ